MLYISDSPYTAELVFYQHGINANPISYMYIYICVWAFSYYLFIL